MTLPAHAQTPHARSRAGDSGESQFLERQFKSMASQGKSASSTALKLLR